MPAPSIDPNRLDPAEVVPADSYRPADPVWVYRAGTWHAGVVVAASGQAATVTYRPAQGPDTAVDTLTAEHLFPRADLDPLLDNGGGPLPSAAEPTAGPNGAAGTDAAARGATAGP